MQDFYKNKLILAPMAGITDLPFRILCKEYGADLLYSEMVSTRGMYYNDRKTYELIQTTPKEQPLIVQIFGCEPEIMAAGAKKLVSLGVSRLDVNMGCPTPKIVNNGDGSALMKDLGLARACIEAVVGSVDVPVSLKMRSGWDDSQLNAPALAEIAQEEGICAVAVHGRTKVQYYSGKANWDMITNVKKTVTIPVIGNGDIYTAEDALRMFEQTKCDSVMIGRGAQGNPFLFRYIKQLMYGEPVDLVSIHEKKETILRHIHLLSRIKGEHIGILEARKHVAWYVKGVKGAASIKNKAFKASTLNEMIEVIQEIE